MLLITFCFDLLLFERDQEKKFEQIVGPQAIYIGSFHLGAENQRATFSSGKPVKARKSGSLEEKAMKGTRTRPSYSCTKS